MKLTNKLCIAITELEARRGGDEAVLTVVIEDSSEGQTLHSSSQRLILASSMLFKVGNIGAGALPYELTMEQYDLLEHFSQLWEAVKKGFDLLAYSDNTRASLITKLRERRFDRELSEEAADYLIEMGYIDERRMIKRAVEQLAGKHYGSPRIRQELMKKGFSREILDEELPELIAEIDFEDSLLRLLARKCELSRLDDRKYRESLYASMYRLGYTPSETRAAIRKLEDESV